VLLLFDIDGTLIRCGGAGRKALVRAFSARHGVPDALAGVRLDGSTDPRIVADAYQASLGLPPPGIDELEALMQVYLQFLAEELASEQLSYTVLKGARELVERALEAGFEVGLATGNDERGARIKLRRGDLERYFAFGGFGSDSADRGELVRAGVARGQARAHARLGRRYSAEEIWVFGDTAADVRAARAAGVRAVGVLHGSWVPEELASAGPDLLAESFDDPALRRAIGLEGPR
jgi:phosphoglycolate phosphatase-like HAD superfamily hydrolase